MSAVTTVKPLPEHSRDWILKKLSEVSLLSDIHSDGQALESLAKIVTTQRYIANTEIIREGENGTEMFILVSGTAAVYKNTPQGDQYKVAILDGAKNIVFGEGGLIENDSRTATIRTEAEVVCIVLARLAFEEFSQEHPEWALPIYRRIAHAVMARLKKTNDDMLLLYNALVAEIRGN